MQVQITHSLVALVVSLGIFAVNASPTPQCADIAVVEAPAITDSMATTIDSPGAIRNNDTPACDADVATVESVSGPTAEQLSDLQTVYTKIVNTVPNHGCTDDFTDTTNVKTIAEVATRENIVPAEYFAGYSFLVKRSHRNRHNSNRNNDANIVGPRFGCGGCGGGGMGGCGINEEEDECEDEEGGSGGSEWFSHNHNQAINQNIDNNQNLNIDEFRPHFGFGGFGGSFGGCGGCDGCDYKKKRSLNKRDDDEGGDRRTGTDNDNQDINQNIIANQNLLANLPVSEFFGSERRTRTGFGGGCCSAVRPVVESDDNFNVQNKVCFADSEGFFEKRSLEKRGRSGGSCLPAIADDTNFNVINRVDFRDEESRDNCGCQGCHRGRNGRNGRHSKRDGGSGEWFSDNHNQDINQNIDNNQNLNVDFFHGMGDGIRELFGGFGGFGGGCGGGYKAKRDLGKRDWACGHVGGVKGCGSTGPEAGSGGGSGMIASSSKESSNTNSNININQNYNPAPECYYEETVEYVPVYETATVVSQIPCVETVTVYTSVPTVEYEYVEVEDIACPSAAPCPKCQKQCSCDESDVNTSSSSSTSSPVVNNYIDVGAAAVGPVEPVVPCTTVETVESCESVDFCDSVDSIGSVDSCTDFTSAGFYKRSAPCDSMPSSSSVEYIGRIGDGCVGKATVDHVETLAAPVAESVDVVHSVITEPVLEKTIIEPVAPVVETVVVKQSLPQPIIETVGHRKTTIQDFPTYEIIHPVPAPAPIVETVVVEPIIEEVVVPAPVIVESPPVVVEAAPVAEYAAAEQLHASKNIKTTATTTCEGLDVAAPAFSFVDNTLNHAPAINGLCA